MNTYSIFTIIISVCALFAYINERYIKLTPAIGLMVMSLASSLLLITFGHLFPFFSYAVTQGITAIDFHDLLMNVMLSFLLFAGAIHVDLQHLKKEGVSVAILASIGTIVSTFIVGTLLYRLLLLFNVQIPYIFCLLFGALISPTDPIAVMAILRKENISASLDQMISGESLFNDGVAVVIFLTIMEVIAGGPGAVSFSSVSLLFLREAVGGLLYGCLLGYIGFFILRSAHSYQVEVLITLAIVMGGYTLAQYIHVSGPLAMVAAGIITGNKGRNAALSDISKDYLSKFWELIDEILNAVLFLLIGFEMLVVKVNSAIMIIGLAAIGIVLFARWVSVAFPVFLLRYRLKFEPHSISILTWGGLRGGLSVALALSLPEDMYRDVFVSITYIIVVFSIVVQGLTIGGLARRLAKKQVVVNK